MPPFERPVASVICVSCAHVVPKFVPSRLLQQDVGLLQLENDECISFFCAEEEQPMRIDCDVLGLSELRAPVPFATDASAPCVANALFVDAI